MGRLNQVPVQKTLDLPAHLLLQAKSSGWLPDRSGAGCQGYLMADNSGQPHITVSIAENITVIHE